MASRVTPARRAALEVMRSVRAGDLLDRALERLGGELPVRDRAWLQELLYGTFRLRGRIDHLLEGRVRSGVGSLQPDVLDVLRLGCYQLLEMGSVPPYAAISQSVELARAAGAGRASGLVNGVLHAVQRERGRLQHPEPESDAVGFLTSWGSHPRWLVERWLDRWGFEATRALVEANNRRPELYLRPVGVDTEAAVGLLAEAGVEAEPVDFAPGSIRVLPPGTALAALAAVPAVVQDPAAALVVRFAAVPSGARVLDLCSAPGGKAVGAAASGAYVAAADLSLGRLQRLRDNVERCGLSAQVGLLVADARRPPFRPEEVVLLDAPCTGTGTLRRHPDGRWRVGERELAELVRLQMELLEAAAGLVRPGGILVYSTCSLEQEENESQVESFLARHPDFVRAPREGVVDADLTTEDGDLLVLPQRKGVDGSYAARLQRIE